MVATRLIDIGTEGRQRIDRYELVAEIASGGMATVYLARLSGMGGFQRFVAIKRLHPHLAKENEFVQMFLDEARLAAGIHHQNVVPILEVGASEHGYYLVMEYIEGDTLARMLARATTAGHKLPIEVGLRVLVDSLQGLHAAHELRDENGKPTELVHRDVSPQNILVGVDGSSRITDFGVARAVTRLSGTRVGQLKGKIAYMSPEQAAGDGPVDRRADVFSAGIVLWEVLAARRLFKSETEAKTLSRVLQEIIPMPMDVAPDVPQQVSDVCMKALSRPVDDRFATCAEFAEVLEAAAVSCGILASPRDVANHVSEVIGSEIAQQREAVRVWLAASEPSQAMRPDLVAAPPVGKAPASSVSAAAMEVSHDGASAVVPSPVAGGRRRGSVLVALGAVAVLVVCAAAVVLVLGRSSGVPTSSASSAAAVGSGLEVPVASVGSVAAGRRAPEAGVTDAGEQPRSFATLPAVEAPHPVRRHRAGPRHQKKHEAPPPSEPKKQHPVPARPKHRKENVDLSNPYR